MPVDKLPSAAENLLDKGVLGTLAFILMVALFFAIKGWLKAKDDRLSDQKEMGAALLKVNDQVSKLFTESIRTDDALRVAVDSLAERQKDLEIEIRRKGTGS